MINSNTFETRPWGSYTVLLDLPHTKVKTITIKPGHAPSYQFHYKRSEHWIVVKGIGVLTLDGVDRVLGPGDSIYIPKKAKHQFKNNGTEDLEFIEVQTGEYFGEDDIVRIKDNYGR